MKAFLKLMVFDLRLYLRDWLTLFWVLIYPLLMLLIFGSMFGNQPGVIEGTRYIESYVPALCVLNVISVSVFTLNINMLTLRENGILRRFRVTPLRASAVLASHSVQGVVLVLLGALKIIVLAKIVWDIPISAISLLTLLGCILFGCLVFFGLGFALSGLTKTAGAASGLAMVVFFPTIFLSGIAMPLEIMPRFMQVISDWLPMTHFVHIAQSVWQGVPLSELGFEFAILAGCAVIFNILAIRFFRWEH